MLERLDAIDWANLHHAYGPATDVPGLLRNLLSPTPEVRERATYELFGTIWHQGTVYEATAAAVPFLYELLEADKVPDKSSIAHLLAMIADGHSYLECHAKDPKSAAIWKSILAKEGKTLDAESAREMWHLAAVKQQVRLKLDVLYPYLRDPEPEIRRSVAVAVGCFPDMASGLLPDLEAAYQDELDEYARQAIAEVIKRITKR